MDQVARVEIFDRFGHDAGLNRDASLPEPLQSLSSNVGVRIDQSNHHVRDSGLDERIGTGRGAAVMRTGLQRDVNG